MAPSATSLAADATRGLAALLEVLLVVLLGAPEGGGGLDERGDRAAGFDADGASRPRRAGAARRRGEKIRRAVLGADVRTLAVDLGRVVRAPEHGKQLVEPDARWVVLDFHHFGVTGAAGADSLVGGVLYPTPLVSHGRRHHTFGSAERCLDAPETSGGEGCLLGLGHGGHPPVQKVVSDPYYARLPAKWMYARLQAHHLALIETGRFTTVTFPAASVTVMTRVAFSVFLSALIFFLALAVSLTFTFTVPAPAVAAAPRPMTTGLAFAFSPSVLPSLPLICSFSSIFEASPTVTELKSPFRMDFALIGGTVLAATSGLLVSGAAGGGVPAGGGGGGGGGRRHDRVRIPKETEGADVIPVVPCQDDLAIVLENHAERIGTLGVKDGQTTATKRAVEHANGCEPRHRRAPAIDRTGEAAEQDLAVRLLEDLPPFVLEPVASEVDKGLPGPVERGVQGTRATVALDERRRTGPVTGSQDGPTRTWSQTANVQIPGSTPEPKATRRPGGVHHVAARVLREQRVVVARTVHVGVPADDE